MSHFNRRWFGATVLVALACAWGTALAAPASSTVAYVSATLQMTNAYLVTWQSATRAHVVAAGGVRDGGIRRNGTQRIITLDQPYSVQSQSGDFDPCINDFPLVQTDTLQIAVATTSGTDSRGTSNIVELGTITTLNGCNAGQVVPFGALTDTGFAAQQVALSMRPSVSDLVPGVALAGPSEDQDDPNNFLANDVLTLQAGGLGTFSASGNVVGAAFDPNGWLVLTMPWGQLGYTRIVVDKRTGAETWLLAQWSAGQPTSAFTTLMVKPGAAGFGTVRQASRMWNSGLFAQTQNPFYIYLYQNGTGERVQVDLAAGTESRSPITWAFNGANIVQHRVSGSGDRLRTWKPLLNGGGKAHFVMEDEVLTAPDGSTSPVIKPRVNFYIDTGAATPPPQ